MSDLAAAFPHAAEGVDDVGAVCVRLPAELMGRLEHACGSSLGHELHRTSRSVIVRMDRDDRSRALELLGAQISAGEQHIAAGEARDVAVSEAMRAQASICGAVRIEADRAMPAGGSAPPRRWRRHGTQPLPIEQLDEWLSRCRTLLDGSGADVTARQGATSDTVEVIVGRAAPGVCCGARQVPAVAAGRFADRCSSCGAEPALETWLHERLEVRDRPDPLGAIVEVPWPAEFVEETHRSHHQAVSQVARAGTAGADALASTVQDLLDHGAEDRHPLIAAAVAAGRAAAGGEARPGTAAITIGDRAGTITIGYLGLDSTMAGCRQIGGVSETALSVAVLGREALFAGGENPTSEQLRWRWSKAIGAQDVPDWLCDSLAAARAGLSSGTADAVPKRTRRGLGL